jgi:serine/threonine protein kinase
LEDRTVIQLSSPGSLARGVRLNGMYEIGTLLAQGGMGEVYRGFNIQTRDPVAIKVILPELARNADAFALFRREASTLHDLQHEAIVRYFVFSVDPDLQRAYLAMEFVDGPSLKSKIAQGPLSLAEVTILRKRIAGALEAAHRVGVIHRDISSDNIILPGNDPRRAKIIDFGIARSQRPGEGTLIGGAFAGKYNYVAPEQLGLAGGEVTAKSDIYSFGLVLAEALRGHPIDMNGTQVEIVEKRRSVPDLSGIDLSMRPLLQTMLQPLPANRPESMAAIAAWGENDRIFPTHSLPTRTLPASRNRGPRGASREGGSSFARTAAMLSVLIPLGAIAGALFLYRDLMPWSGAGSVGANRPEIADAPHDSPPPIAPPIAAPGPTHKPPPLPDIPANPVNAGSNPPAEEATKPSVAVAVPPAAPRPAAHVPTADEIVQSSPAIASRLSANNVVSGETPVSTPPPPPAAPKTSDLAPASPVATPAPAPTALQAPAPPAPQAPPPRAPQSVVSMDDAEVGRDYVADLPPFSDSGSVGSLVLRADPAPPEGLSFVDMGSGFSQLSGKPTKLGQFSFDILARNATGGTARMTARINVTAPEQPSVVVANPLPTPPAAAQSPISAPTAPISTPNPPAPNPIVASLSPSDKTAAFLRGFDGGACFFARPLSAAPNSTTIQGIGSDKAAFERFYNAFIHETGVEPTLNVRLIAPGECPAVDLIRAGGLNNANGPRIDLSGYDVGRGKPLSGTVSNLAGRHLDLLLVSNDGNVYRLDSRALPGGGGASFNVPITPDVTSIGALQLLLAVTSPKAMHALEGFKAGAAKEILPRLRGEMPGAAASLEVEFFKLVE